MKSDAPHTDEEMVDFLMGFKGKSDNRRSALEDSLRRLREINDQIQQKK